MNVNISLAFACKVATAVQNSGGRALIVGGWVRDQLRGCPSEDIDLEIFGIPQQELPRLLEKFGRVEAVGKSFPVYKLVSEKGSLLDVALPRLESKKGQGHTGFEVRGNPEMTPSAAARRRDFTVNAISWDPLSETYVDPFDGRSDLNNRLLRAVDPTTFGDDSLRVLRAVQFAARFEFTLEDTTATLCRNTSLNDLSAERVWDELEKLLLLADRPSIGFALALDFGVIDQWLPELRALVGCPQEAEWHPEGDVWTHTCLVIDQARALNGDLSQPLITTIMLAALCHDLGKPATTAVIDGRIRSLNHEEGGVKPTVQLLDRLNIYTLNGYDVRKQVLGLVAHHLKPGMFYKAPTVTDGAFRRLAQKVDLELLARLARADCLGRTGDFDCSAMDWFINRARTLGVEHEPPKPLLMGRHLIKLGLTPGPKLGKILKKVYEKQLDGQIKTLEEGIVKAQELLK